MQGKVVKASIRLGNGFTQVLNPPPKLSVLLVLLHFCSIYLEAYIYLPHLLLLKKFITCPRHSLNRVSACLKSLVHNLNTGAPPCPIPQATYNTVHLPNRHCHLPISLIPSCPALPHSDSQISLRTIPVSTDMVCPSL